MPRYLLCGSRTWHWVEPVEDLLTTFPDDTVIIHGAGRGLDTLAGELAFKHGFDIEAYEADWKRYGKSAGPIRNAEMLEKGKPERVFAFIDPSFASPGTHGMIALAKEKRVPVEIYRQGEGWE